VVLACRQLDYRDISQTATGQAASVSVLTDARHVMLRPLDAKDVIGYLTERFRGRDGHLRSRWQPVADALGAGGPLLQVLANPWQLFLAVTAYTAENSDPADLLTMSPDQVETHLLANLIPAVTEHNETANRHGWTSERITCWLTTIADHQYRAATEHGSSQIDIYLPELWRVTGRRYPRWVPAIMAATPLLAIGGLALTADLLVGRILGGILILGAAFGGYAAFDSTSTMRRLDTAAVWTPRGRRNLRNHLASVLAVGLAVGLTGELTGGLTGGLTLGLTLGLAFGLAFGLTVGLAGDVEAVPSPTGLARQCVTYSLAFGLAFGLAVGLTLGLTFGLTVGLTVGLAAGLAFGHGNVWVPRCIKWVCLLRGWLTGCSSVS